MKTGRLASSIGGGLRWLSRTDRKRVIESMRMDGIRAALRLKKVLLKRRARQAR